MQATTYQVPIEGTLYYTDANSPKNAVTKVSMRLIDQLKPYNVARGVWLNEMVDQYEVKAIPWPDEYPELRHPKAVELLKEIEKVAPDGPVDWQKLGEIGRNYNISDFDIMSLQNYVSKIIKAPVEESSPQPPSAEQLQFEFSRIQAFFKDSTSKHPAATIAGIWKSAHKMKFVTIDRLQDIVADDKALISVKMDGELVTIWYKDGKAETVTAKGTVRSSFPAIDEVAVLLKDHKEAAFMGELYAVDEQGKPMSYMKSSSIIRDPASGKDSQLRLGVFDIITIDSKDYVDASIEDKMQIINDTFKDGKSVQPVHYVQGGIDEAEKLWDQLSDKGWEGLVVYIGTMIYKVKPIMSYDMVVVAVEKSPRFIDQIGATLCAFIDKEGMFRLNGSVGGGFTDQEKAQLYDWAEKNKIAEDETRIWVDPFKDPIVVEVEAVEVNIKDRPKMQFKDSKWVTIEDDISGVLRFPHVKRIRDDKEPTYRDVPFEQLPIREESAEVHHLAVGNKVEVITGQIGKIIGIVPNSGDSGYDLDIIVEWDQPLWGEITQSEIHPSEITRSWE